MDKEEITKKNSAIIRADFPSIVENVRIKKEIVIIQKHNRDVAAIVPLDHLKHFQKKEPTAK